MSNDPPVTALVTCAANGDRSAWESLVERYAPLIWSICRRYQLDDAAAGDVGQAVWLQLLDHLGEMRDPASLAGWLATTTRTECGRVLRAARAPQAAGPMLDADSISDEQTPIAEQELLAADRHAVLREALARLPRRCQQLIALLSGDPPLPDAQISATLGIPAGSIGPCRSRCLDKLRRDPAIAALINTKPRPREATHRGRPWYSDNDQSLAAHTGPATQEPQLTKSRNPGSMAQNRQLCAAQPQRTYHEHAAHTEGATVASTVTYLLPVVAIVLGVLVLGESITVYALVGIALVLAGVALTRRRAKPATDEPQAS